MRKAIFIFLAGLAPVFSIGAEAPLPIRYTISQLKKGDVIILSWNEVLKAADYRLQIASDKDFTAIVLETLLKRNRYEIYAAFFPAGVYYWRISGLLTLNNGARKEGRFSEPYSFAVSKKASAAGLAPLGAPALPRTVVFNGKKPPGWTTNPAFRYYRLQFSETPDFMDPLLDTFTDKEPWEISGLPVEYGKRYFMRLKGSDGASGGAWSKASKVTFEAPKPIVKNVRESGPRKK